MGSQTVSDSQGATNADRDTRTVVVSDAIRVIVIGSERVSRRGMAEMLGGEDGIEVVAVVPDLEALSTVGRVGAQVAVVLYDDAFHLDLCRLLSIRDPRVEIVIADSFRCVRDFTTCQDAGASGFVLRDSPSVTHAAAVRAVASGREFHDPAIPEEALDPFNLDRLTDQEFKVLTTLWPGCTNRELAEELHVTEHTVKFHLKRIYDKLEVHSREQALVIALEEGIVKYQDPRRHT